MSVILYLVLDGILHNSVPKCNKNDDYFLPIAYGLTSEDHVVRIAKLMKGVGLPGAVKAIDRFSALCTPMEALDDGIGNETTECNPDYFYVDCKWHICLFSRDLLFSLSDVEVRPFKVYIDT
ncbi:unnamed protein product [Protopolystoma xenopodis]|uniref:Uncharacterized protein n=1 Tax=Protopolystoma xenopodis TaxID=117903 RepID=A0A3S5CRP6_9PLAT|nr:unnamed protein product [Protopolystoma xenopodis]